MDLFPLLFIQIAFSVNFISSRLLVYFYSIARLQAESVINSPSLLPPSQEPSFLALVVQLYTSSAPLLFLLPSLSRFIYIYHLSNLN